MQQVGENPKLQAMLEQLRSKLRELVVPEDDPELLAAQEALRRSVAEERRARFPEHLRACGVPEGALGPYREGLQMRPALAAVQAWTDDTKPLCLLSGSNGIGKSVAAAYALRLATKRVGAAPNHPRADLIEVERLDASQGLFLRAQQVRDALRYEDNPAKALLYRAAVVRILVLDELRDVDFRGVGLERFEEIVGGRYDNGRRTVITTNLTSKELLGRLSNLLRSRFEGGCLVFEASGQDMRRPS